MQRRERERERERGRGARHERLVCILLFPFIPCVFDFPQLASVLSFFLLSSSSPKMGGICSAPELPTIDMVALGARVAGAVQAIVEDVPNQMFLLVKEIAEEKERKVTKERKELLGATEDAVLTDSREPSNMLAIAVAALQLSAMSTLVDEVQWAVWREVTEPVAWKAFGHLWWTPRWFAMRAARKASDQAVEKACQEAVVAAVDTIKKNGPPLVADGPAPVKAAKIQVKPAAANGQVAPMQ